MQLEDRISILDRADWLVSRVPPRGFPKPAPKDVCYPELGGTVQTSTFRVHVLCMCEGTRFCGMYGSASEHTNGLRVSERKAVCPV